MILALAFEPRPIGARGVAGTRYLRLRVGDLRVVYLVNDEARSVVVARIAKRSEHTYRRLANPTEPTHRLDRVLDETFGTLPDLEVPSRSEWVERQREPR